MQARDSAFLFHLYVSLLCGITLDPGWYSKERSTRSINNILKWMAQENKREGVLEAGNEVLKAYMKPLVEKLVNGVVNVDVSSEEGTDSDADN